MSLHVYSADIDSEDIASVIAVKDTQDFELDETEYGDFTRELGDVASEYEISLKAVVFEDY